MDARRPPAALAQAGLPGRCSPPLGLLALSVSAALYAPRAVSAAAHDFGVIGVAFALLTLLFCVMFVFVTAAGVGATLAEWQEERRS